MNDFNGVYIFLEMNSFSIGSYVCQRIPLDFLQGEKFKEAADNYIRPLLTKVYTIIFRIIYVLFNSNILQTN